MPHLHIYHGGAYIEEQDQNYVGGSKMVFEEIIAKKLNMAFVKVACGLLGYNENAQLMYKVPSIDGKFRLQRIDIEDHVLDMACVDRQYGIAELYVVHDFILETCVIVVLV